VTYAAESIISDCGMFLLIDNVTQYRSRLRSTVSDVSWAPRISPRARQLARTSPAGKLSMPSK
jgi:hypothetical protein